jgi:hypothetical protein
MWYISGTLNDVFSGDFNLGIGTQQGSDELGNFFKELVIGFIFFNIEIGKIVEEL